MFRGKSSPTSRPHTVLMWSSSWGHLDAFTICGGKIDGNMGHAKSHPYQIFLALDLAALLVYCLLIIDFFEINSTAESKQGMVLDHGRIGVSKEM